MTGKPERRVIMVCLADFSSGCFLFEQSFEKVAVAHARFGCMLRSRTVALRHARQRQRLAQQRCSFMLQIHTAAPYVI